MPSPVEIPFRSFVQIDRKSASPIFLQIANACIRAIQRNILLPDTKLPGSRALGELLEVHRNTIVSAYEELAAQGWISIKPNQGSFVSAELPVLKAASAVELSYPKSTGFKFKTSSLLDNPYEQTACHYVFNDGTPDIRLTQIEDLSRIYSSNMKRKSNRRKMGYYNQDGSEYFKQQLATYLRFSRGLHISSANLLITRSTEMSLFIISEILLKPGDLVVVAKLSYFSANMIFQKNGASIRTVPVDQDGIDVNALRKICETQEIRMVYISPQHHYPTTVSLSATRRMLLLQLAQEFKFIIVEDDQDYDFHYDKQPLLPLVTNDTSGMVIYVGSFGKSLAPGFRTGFIVAPENLMLEMRKHLGIIDRQGDVLMEQALGEMIEEGAIHRHLKKSLKVYRERRDQMSAIIQDTFEGWLSIQKPSGGLACWAQFSQPVNLIQLSNRCGKHQLFLPRNILYQDPQTTAMRIGFGHLNVEEMEESMQILKSMLQQV